MRYQEIKPGKLLAPYIKCYYIYESDTTTAFDDTVFPSGCVEIIFNLGSGHWQTATSSTFITTPPIELWGQITRPLAIKSAGRNVMLGIRFYPHAAAVFLRDPVDLFNNQVIDFRDCSDKAVQTLYAQLQDITLWDTRIQLVENFLLQRLAISTQSGRKIAVVNDVMREIRRHDFFDNIDNVASRYGITSRYLQKYSCNTPGLPLSFIARLTAFSTASSCWSKKRYH